MTAGVRRRVRVTPREALTREESGWLKRAITPCAFASEADALAAWEVNREALTAECAPSRYIPWAAAYFDAVEGPLHPYTRLWQEAHRGDRSN